jgi:hypothetical protein
MKKLVILFLATFILSSCGTEEIPYLDEEHDEKAMACRIPPYFNSEEDFINYVLEVQNGTRDEIGEDYYWDELFAEITHYYKLKNPPQGAMIFAIQPGPITVRYDTHNFEYNGDNEHLWIRYSSDCSPNCSNCPPDCSMCHRCSGYDIETEEQWVNRKFPEESYILEKDGLKYYIRKENGMNYPHWRAEWYSANGNYMDARFPYRFTPEEVLGYISNIERIEIQ